ncbi:MAG: hypothetical protein IJM27_03575 [Eubacterium sp.]|nr:hypothetical protein [Eubacterium sp.]
MAMSMLEAALTFFADKMRILLTILTTDITTYEGGVIWNAISSVYDAILAMGVTVAGVLIWFGLLSSTSRYAELKKASVWVQFLIEIVLTNAVLYYGKYLLLECIKIGQGMTEKLMNVTGMMTTNGNSIFSVSVPQDLSVAVDSLSLGKGILLFVVVLIGAIFIVVSTIGVLLTVYGRLFNLYLMIAISPLPIATAIGKPTRFVFYNFVKSFLSVVLEALIVVLVLYIFTQFVGSSLGLDSVLTDYMDPNVYLMNLGIIPTNNMSKILGSTVLTPEQIAEYQRLVEIKESLGSYVFSYIAEMAFLFMMLFGMLKGTERLVHKIFGI